MGPLESISPKHVGWPTTIWGHAGCAAPCAWAICCGGSAVVPTGTPPPLHAATPKPAATSVTAALILIRSITSEPSLEFS